MHFQGQSGIEAGEGKHRSQTAKRLTARVRQSDFGRYSRLVLALWLFRSLNTQIENALNAFDNNGSSVFLAEAKRFIGDQEFRFVVMGPDRGRVDTIRLQAWGIQTRKARQQLEGWATETLSSLNRGQLPRDFIRQLYAGANVGNDGMSNGFCNVQVLQQPITPGRPSASDRITIDLIFDKTD